MMNYENKEFWLDSGIDYIITMLYAVIISLFSMIMHVALELQDPTDKIFIPLSLLLFLTVYFFIMMILGSIIYKFYLGGLKNTGSEGK